MYVGNSAGLERTLVPQTGIRTYLFRMAPPSSLRGFALLALATVRSMAVALRTRPRAALATGGYACTPAALACWVCRVPLVLFLPDVVPGKAVSWLVPLARKIAVSTDDALRYLPAEKTIVTGYPVRESFADVSRDQGRDHFELPGDATVLLVFGGSQGARSINEALADCLPDLLDEFYVLHVSGEQRYAEAQSASASLTSDRRGKYRLYPYLHDRDMALALAAADLVLCRSGASTLAELPAVGVPAVLVPLPEPRVHQRENAAYLADHGAAIVLENDELSDRLCSTLLELLRDRTRLSHMAGASLALSRPDAAAAIGILVNEVAG